MNTDKRLFKKRVKTAKAIAALEPRTDALDEDRPIAQWETTTLLDLRHARQHHYTTMRIRDALATREPFKTYEAQLKKLENQVFRLQRDLREHTHTLDGRGRAIKSLD